MEPIEQTLQRYQHALETIVCTLEPLGSSHTHDCVGCQGCAFEWDEALTMAMNVLAGLDPRAHWGPPHRIGVDPCSREELCEPCKEHLGPGKEARERAWLDRGFVHEEETDYESGQPNGNAVWRRGTAF